MYLYANGCSMAYGSELHDDPSTGRCTDDAYRLRYSWPGRLRGLLEADGFHNDAVPSGSNDRILRTTVAFVAGWLRRDLPADALAVVIGWSHPARREFHVGGAYRQIVPHHHYDIRSLDRLVARYRSAVDIGPEGADRYATQVTVLGSFLRQQGIGYLFFNAVAPAHLPAGLRGGPSEGAFTDGHFLDWDDAESTMSAVLRRQPGAWSDQHPNESGHRYWAERLVKHLDPAEFGGVPAPVLDAAGVAVAGGAEVDRRHDRKGTERVGRYLRARRIERRLRRSDGSDPFIYP